MSTAMENSRLHVIPFGKDSVNGVGVEWALTQLPELHLVVDRVQYGEQGYLEKILWI